MKRFTLITLSLFVAMLFVGCSQDITNVPETDSDTNITADEVHSIFLKQLYSSQDFAKSAKSEQTNNATTVTNDILTRYGENPMTETEVEAALESGRQMAQMDPEELIAQILQGDDLQWWHRFADQATAKNCRQVYTNHCYLYGAPEPGSVLATLTGVAMSSAEFWSEYRKDDTPRYHNPYVPEQSEKSWRGVFRFIVAVAVDGGSGAASAAAGPIVSGVVGGLASAGADHIIFGDD